MILEFGSVYCACAIDELILCGLIYNKAHHLNTELEEKLPYDNYSKLLLERACTMS